MRASVSGHEDDAVADQLVCDSHRLIREATVVTNNEPDILAEDAASCIDMGDRHFGTLLDLLTSEDVLSGYRTSDSNQYLGVGGRDVGRCHDDRGQRQGFGGDDNLTPSPTIP